VDRSPETRHATKDESGEEGTVTRAEAPRPVLVRNATIWTMGPAGTLLKGDLLLVGRKVSKVGGAIEPPRAFS